MAAPESLGRPQVSIPDSGAASGAVEVRVQARYASGRTVSGVVPLRFDVFAPDAALNDYSRFTATEADGSWATSFPIAANEPAGTWSVRVTELIGGSTSVASFEVADVPPSERVTPIAADLRTTALWRFDADAETAEALGGKYTMTLRGRSRFVEDGKSGGCLECFAADGDEAEGVEIASRPGLSPGGAFSAELWLKPKPELAGADISSLLDCNYYFNTRDIPKANAGFAFLLRSDAEGVRPVSYTHLRAHET